MKQLNIKTSQQVEMVDITGDVRKVVRDSGAARGVCYVYVPHTSAGVTINENTDPHVKEDILNQLSKLAPQKGEYKHGEGNSAAHIKASIVGPSEVVFVESGKLVLGAWQSIFLCEFDGPRSRNVLVKIVKED
ncbi:MAG: secondary thiamine-phosphate synthase enzyme YjbQ [Deltaproteobacteria bacterium]